MIVVLAVAGGCGDGGPRVRVHLTTEDYEAAPGSPVEGAQVAFVVDGGTPDVATTGGDGVAELAVADGATGTVMVLRTDRARPELYVATGVGADARVEFGARALDPPTSEVGIQTVTFPLYPGGPWSYDSDFVPCTDGGMILSPGTLTVETEAGCAMGPRTMYLTAYQEVASPQAFAAVDDVVAVPGTLTAGGWEPGTDYGITITGLPPTVSTAYTELAYPTSWRLVIINTAIAGGTGTGTRREATMTGTPSMRTQVRFADLSMPIELYRPTFTPGDTLDAAAAALPPAITVQGYDPATRALTWTETAGAPPSLVVATFEFLDPVTHMDVDWTVYAPTAGGRLVMPEIPDAITDYDLRPTDGIVLRQLWLVTVDGDSYADLLETVDLDLPRFGGDVFLPDRTWRLSGGNAVF